MQERNKSHCTTATRTQDLWHTVRALCLLSYRATQSAFDNFPCLIKFVTESARNHAKADETCTLMLATRDRTPKLAGKCHMGGKSQWLDTTLTGLQVCWVVWSPCWLPLVSHSPARLPVPVSPSPCCIFTGPYGARAYS